MKEKFYELGYGMCCSEATSLSTLPKQNHLYGL